MEDGLMTKSDLIEIVAEKVDLTKKQTEIIVNEIFDSIKKTLGEGGPEARVEIRGFGSFKVRERNPREGRNPKTGEPVRIRSKRVPVFKAGKELKERVDN
jgi:integration host factor subunit beta